MNLRDIGQQLLAQKRAAFAQATRQGGYDGLRPKPPAPTRHKQGKDWLKPLADVTDSATTAPNQPQPTLAETVAINPALLGGMVHNEQTSAGRLWLLCRAIDSGGRGVVSLQTVRQKLTDKASYFGSWRRIRQIVADGDGVFWTRAEGRDGKPQLYLTGAAMVGKRLEIGRLARHNVALPTAELLRGAQRARAAFYAAFHAGRDSNPISRATVANVTGMSERSQRAYDGMIAVERQANYTLVANSEQPNSAEGQAAAWQHGQASFPFIDHHGQQGEAGKSYYAARLPNSYHSPLKRAANGRRRKIARKLKDDLVTMGAQGNVNQQPRLFHRDGRQASLASRRQTTVFLYQHDTPQQRTQGNRRDGKPGYGWWHQLDGEIAHS